MKYWEVSVDGEQWGVFSSENSAQVEYLECCARFTPGCSLVELLCVEVVETNVENLLACV